MNKLRAAGLAGLVTLAVLAQPAIAKGAEISVLCSNGFKAALEELIPQFQQATSHKVKVTYGLSAVLERQIEAGQRFDLAVLTPSLIDELIKQGMLAGDTRATLARSAIALAVRAGAAKPDVGNIDALKRTLLASRSMAYAREGASASFFVALLQRLDLAEPLKARIRLAASGDEVAASVARGEIELGVLPVSEILSVGGIEVGGTFPADVRGYVTMVAGVSRDAAQSTAASELIAFLTAPAALPVIRKKGMDRGQ